MKKVFAVIVLSLLVTAILAAQSTTIRGTVLDGRQEGIAGAEVVVKSADSVVAQAQTGLEGRFEVSLKPGTYTFQVTAAGFDTAVQAINIASDSVSLSLAMKVPEASEPGPAHFDADRADLGSEDGFQQLPDDEQEAENYLQEFAAPGRVTDSDDLVFGLLLGEAPSARQTAAIRGTVVDDQQAVVAGAGVVVKSGLKVLANVQTGSDGTFDIPLETGQYTVEVTAAGFDKAVQTVNLTPNLAPLSFPLKVPKLSH